MTSLGGGFGLLLLCVFWACFSESAWVKIIAGGYAFIYVIVSTGLVILGRVEPVGLIFPLAVVLFAVFVSGIKTNWGKFP